MRGSFVFDDRQKVGPGVLSLACRPAQTRPAGQMEQQLFARRPPPPKSLGTSTSSSASRRSRLSCNSSPLQVCHGLFERLVALAPRAGHVLSTCTSSRHAQQQRVKAQVLQQVLKNGASQKYEGSDALPGVPQRPRWPHPHLAVLLVALAAPPAAPAGCRSASASTSLPAIALLLKHPPRLGASTSLNFAHN